MANHDTALRAMAERRREALRDRARREIALAILEQHGSVDADTVQTRLDAEWVEPTDEQLAGQVAQKASAAVQFLHRQLLGAQDALERAERKARKFADLAKAAEAGVTAARTDLVQAGKLLAEAQDLAAHANSNGDASQVPASSSTEARAGVATAKGSS